VHLNIRRSNHRVGALPIAIVSDNGAGFDPTQAGVGRGRVHAKTLWLIVVVE
jgi:hypothetical protein